MTQQKKDRLPSFTWQSPVGIASFAKIGAPDTEGEYADGKYKLDLILPISKKLQEFEDKMSAMATSCFGSLKNVSIPLKNGNDKDTEKYPLYKDQFYITPKSQRPPATLDLSNKPIEADKIYSGAFVRILVSAVCYKTGATKGVTLYLNAVQFVKDGERLDGEGVGVTTFTDDDAELEKVCVDIP